MRKRWIILDALALFVVGVLLFNASVFATPHGKLALLAHRGVHQRFSTEGLKMDDCTATRVAPIVNDYIENTIPSMRAAFDAGADVVEIDVHPTTDGDFAVFHDWVVDCRTDGHGAIREHSMAELRALDVGYGYTADGGETFPLRGKGAGMMPSLSEVLSAFPTQGFLVNYKSNYPSEADQLVTYLKALPQANVERLMFYGGDRPVARTRELLPEVRTASRSSLKACAGGYLAMGWLGVIPKACRHSIVFAPANIAWIAWGWPNRFLARMQSVDTEVFIAAPLKFGQAPILVGIDDADAWKMVPRNWRGGVSTDAIETIGPLAEQR